MAAPMPGMVTTCRCGEGGRAAKASLSKLPHLVLGSLRVAHLSHEIANQRLGHGAGQASDGLLSDQVHLLGQFRSEIGDLLQGGEPGLADAFGRGILVEELQHPARR